MSSAGAIGSRTAARRRRRARALVALAMAAAVLAAGGALLLVASGESPLRSLVGVAVLGLGLIFAPRMVTRTAWLTFVVLAVMFVPARRYSLGTVAGVEAEPGRFLLVLALSALAYRVLVRGRRGKTMPLGPLLLGLVGAASLACVVNYPLLVEVGLSGSVPSTLLLFILLFGVYLVVAQLVEDARVLDRLLVVVLWSAVVVAVLALVERVTGTNLVWSIGDRLPISRLASNDVTFRSGGTRAFGTAQHPIALATMLAAVVPLAFHQSIHASWVDGARRRTVHLVAAIVLLGGVAAAVSRTSVLAIAAGFLVVLVLRPAVAVAVAGFGIVATGVGYVLQPKLISGLLLGFLDPEALLASQETSAGSNGQGRLADLGPASVVFHEHPLFGTGLGRITGGVSDPTLQILDNQYLGTLLDSGLVGVIALIALLWAPVARMARMSMRSDVESSDRDLALALAVSFAMFAVGAYFFDFFAFQQATQIWCLFLGIGAYLIRRHGSRPLVSRQSDGRSPHVEAAAGGSAAAVQHGGDTPR